MKDKIQAALETIDEPNRFKDAAGDLANELWEGPEHSEEISKLLIHLAEELIKRTETGGTDVNELLSQILSYDENLATKFIPHYLQMCYTISNTQNVCKIDCFTFNHPSNVIFN
jgi:hypothetical protein